MKGWVGARQSVQLLRRWVRVSGRDVVATTRDSIVSIEARSGAVLFVGLWVCGVVQAGPWTVWGADLGGEILPQVREWFSGRGVLLQAVLLGAHVAIGIFWGVVIQNGWALLGQVAPSIHPDRLRKVWVAGLTGAIALAGHGGLLLRDLARHPAVYQETFLDRGGAAHWVQAMANGPLAVVAGPVSMALVGGLGLLALLRLLQRAGHWFLRFAPPTRIAIGVLGGALILFGMGLKLVLWVQRERNEGPNLVLFSVDGLRDDRLKEGSPSAPFLSSFSRTAHIVARAVPPSVDLGPTLVTGLTGRSPLSHGLRHDFPAAEDLGRDLESFPAFLRENGWWTECWADGPTGILERLAEEFDVARVPSSDLGRRVFRRMMERSPHLLPYISGRWGRRLPLLRGSSLLADPQVLAEEVSVRLGSLKKKRKFMLWVHFSSPGPEVAVASPRAALRTRRDRGEGPLFFRRPGDGRVERPLTEPEFVRLGRLYDAALLGVDHAIRSVAWAVERRGLKRSTAVMVWSPRSTLLSGSEEFDARSLRGPALFGLPLLGMDPGIRPGLRRFSGWARAVDVAPTAARLLRISAPGEGGDLTRGLPAGESGGLMVETSGLFREPTPAGGLPRAPDRPGALGPHLPPFTRLLVEDPESPGHLKLDPVWEDRVLVYRDRLLQMGHERVLYRPGWTGVTFEYYRLDSDPEARQNLAGTSLGRARLKELREMLFRRMAREPGWRPQNDYWIPEALLREREGSDGF